MHFTSIPNQIWKPQTAVVLLFYLAVPKVANLSFLEVVLNRLHFLMRTMRLILAFLIFTSCRAVDRSKFRTCAETGFCRRYRGQSTSRDGYNVSSNISSAMRPSYFVNVSPQSEIYLLEQIFLVRLGCFHPCTGCGHLGRKNKRIVS
jgi:hypothetical protein